MGAKIEYSITTLRCPYCGRVISKETDLVPKVLFLVFFIITIPVALAEMILNTSHMFNAPAIPDIGKSRIRCPRCGEMVATGKKELKDCTQKQALDYKFRGLFKLSYFLGGLMLWGAAITLIYVLDEESRTLLPAVWVGGIVITMIVFAIIIGIIVFVYRNKCNQISY